MSGLALFAANYICAVSTGDGCVGLRCRARKAV